MTGLLGKFNDGGPIFTYPILIFLIVVLALFLNGILKKEGKGKIISLISSIGWFAVAWGFMGRTIGLIKAFDMVSAHGELTPKLLAEGLKMALVDPLFGVFVFLVARLGMIILISLQKE
ncbi:MAG: MotA/TolQ/ExbB proton channel family protein [Prolixibacteraceae bacterium]|jgi:hypothetical protein|nr:MotA/TolQ/ExbB proton channel family protein [Prolixibacteraceae bacterium]MBT6005988.1 MotA/TolQ/ExbB proton channel family protein [Prolixibacteraceae bacterium]MBT6997587.1 MotA/TolQ/ExbB proton channel family protein [Prolixibacteraceae bacterium]MBT7394414.1 MotA/TolQ/ExbB proton channel family protein [Prolixibacteraceae bacterium]